LELDALTGLPIGELVERTAGEWPEAKAISGHFVTLEALDASRHAVGLWQQTGGMQHAALWQYMSEGPFEDTLSFDAAMHKAAAETDPAFFAIIDNATGSVVGRISLLNIRPNHKAIEVGHVLFSPAMQQTPGATEAIYLLTKYAFDELGYRRYEWKCNALNAKSRSAAVRLGFTFEGLFRQHMIIKGRNRDTAWYSMLAEDWPQVRAAMEAWLALENFDEHGKQRTRLSELMMRVEKQ